MENIHANVNKNTCIGCGICVDICPSVFGFDPHGLAEASLTVIEPSLNGAVKQAARACPTAAINIY